MVNIYLSLNQKVDRFKISITCRNFSNMYDHIPGGGGTSLWVRRGCAPVLGSFGLKILGLGYPFTGKFL